MKWTIFALGLISLLPIASAFAHEREIGESARQLSADFRKKNPTLDFRATLFSANSCAASILKLSNAKTWKRSQPK